MPPSDVGAGAADAAVAAAPARAGRSGPTRAAPVLLLALASVLLAARVALGIYEHVRPVERTEPFGAPNRGP